MQEGERRQSLRCFLAWVTEEAAELLKALVDGETYAERAWNVIVVFKSIIQHKVVRSCKVFLNIKPPWMCNSTAL